jgi:Peptidase A4 family
MTIRRLILSVAILAVGLAGLSSAAAATEPGGSVQFAGYVATVPAAASLTAEATLTVPMLNCAETLGSFDPASVGPSVEVTGGKSETLADIIASCNGDDPVYRGVAIFLTTKVAIHAGDIVRLRVNVKASPFIARATLIDVTTGQSQSFSRSTGPYTPTGAQVGMNAFGLPVAEFATVQWTDATVGGWSLGSLNPEALNMIRNPNHPKTLVRTSPLSSSGGSFRNIWVASS